MHVHERMDRLPPRVARLYRRLVAKLATRVVLIAGFLADEWEKLRRRDRLDRKHRSWDLPERSAVREPVIGPYLGRIAPRKGIEHLVRAFKIVRAEVPNARLVVVGGPAEPEDYPYLDGLRAEVAGLGLSDAVEFRGPVEDPAGALADFAVLGFTSPIDIAPVTVLQAMALGIPVVAASDGGARGDGRGRCHRHHGAPARRGRNRRGAALPPTRP